MAPLGCHGDFQPPTPLPLFPNAFHFTFRKLFLELEVVLFHTFQLHRQRSYRQRAGSGFVRQTSEHAVLQVGAHSEAYSDPIRSHVLDIEPHSEACPGNLPTLSVNLYGYRHNNGQDGCFDATSDIAQLHTMSSSALDASSSLVEQAGELLNSDASVTPALETDLFFDGEYSNANPVGDPGINSDSAIRPVTNQDFREPLVLETHPSSNPAQNHESQIISIPNPTQAQTEISTPLPHPNPFSSAELSNSHLDFPGESCDEADLEIPPGFTPTHKDMLIIRELIKEGALLVSIEYQKDFVESVDKAEDGEILQFFNEKFQKPKPSNDDTNFVTYHNLRRTPQIRRPAKLPIWLVLPD